MLLDHKIVAGKGPIWAKLTGSCQDVRKILSEVFELLYCHSRFPALLARFFIKNFISITSLYRKSYIKREVRGGYSETLLFGHSFHTATALLRPLYSGRRINKTKALSVIFCSLKDLFSLMWPETTGFR